ncbi:unnamed protein product [Phytophthora fragariaefolia]|uniref:Unnamed protein product n=1 Tax=Phytophthora fragariaefolia TaxID=1490495 RepID=A0A9W6XL19_9STRA|nr:unnamed protein product [Phytophthora fragariaefolia]
MIAMAGDFNTYADETLDRESYSERTTGAQLISQQFRDWLAASGMESTFRRRHPPIRRYTYERNGTRTALDDIFVSTEHGVAVEASGIWLSSIMSSDHVGTPFVVFKAARGGNIARTLSNVTDIRVVNTRTKKEEEMLEFKQHTQQLLQQGHITLIPDIDDGNTSPEATLQWLEEAITNLNECMYTSEKFLWGETNSQSRRQLARSVCIQRSNRCTAQIRQLYTFSELESVSFEELRLATEAVLWPRWVLHPEQLPTGCAHGIPTKILREALNALHQCRDIDNLITWVADVGKKWRKVMRTRRNWRQTTRMMNVKQQRRQYFDSGETRRFLRSALGAEPPPVTIRSAIIATEEGPCYTEDKLEVTREISALLDSWIPPDERTMRP